MIAEIVSTNAKNPNMAWFGVRIVHACFQGQAKSKKTVLSTK